MGRIKTDLVIASLKTKPNGGGYQYKDIWNNVRLSYSDSTGNGIITQDEIVQERNYYPFGLVHKGYNDFIKGRDHTFKTYQGQEFTTDLGLDAHEWKFRMSDPASGRFWQLDPLAEDYVYNSTYAFQENKMGMGVELEGKELRQHYGLGATKRKGGYKGNISKKPHPIDAFNTLKGNSDRFEYGESIEGDSNGDGTVGFFAKVTEVVSDDFVSGIAALGGLGKDFSFGKFISTIMEALEGTDTKGSTAETSTETTQTDSGGTQKEEKSSGESEQGGEKPNTAYPHVNDAPMGVNVGGNYSGWRSIDGKKAARNKTINGVNSADTVNIDNANKDIKIH